MSRDHNKKTKHIAKENRLAIHKKVGELMNTPQPRCEMDAVCDLALSR